MNASTSDSIRAVDLPRRVSLPCERTFRPHHHGPKDEHGCILPDGHKGPHLFRDEEGQEWGWEYDMECTCPDCCTDSFETQCLLYWKANMEMTNEHDENL